MSLSAPDGRLQASLLPRLRLLLVAVLAVLVSTLLPICTLAQFTEVLPYVKTAVALDSARQTLYFTHASTSVIDAVMLKTGVQMTYSVNASLSRPSGLAVDTDGNLLIADTGNHRVVRLNTTTGELSAVYITSPSLQWPCDVAVDASDGSLLVADTWNHRIVRLSPHGQQLFVYTSASPSLHYPAGVSLDSAGRVFIADTGNNRIVQMSAAGEVVAVYATSSSSLSAPLGVVVDGDGNLLIADSGNDRVVKVSATGIQQAEYRADDPLLRYPSGLTTGYAGELYVADSGNNRIVRFSPQLVESEYVTQFPSFNGPTGVAVDSGGNFIIVDWGNSRVVKGGPASEFFTVYDPPLVSASRLALDAVGALYVSDLAGSVLKLSATGSSLTSFTTANPSLSYPHGLTVNAAGELFIADSGNNRIVRLNATGALLAVFNTSGPALYAPLDVALHGVDGLYILDSGNNRVVKLNASSREQLATYNTTNPSLNWPSALTLDAAGRMYIVDSDNNRVVKLGADGELLAVYGTNSSLRSPAAIALDAVGNIVISDSDNDRIVVFNVHPMFASASYQESAPVTEPWGVTEGADGAIYTSLIDGRIVKRSANGQVVFVYSVRGGVNSSILTGIAVDASGVMYTTDQSNNCIVKLSASGEQLASLITSSPGLSRPMALVFDSAGALLVADFDNNRIVKLSTSGEQLAVYSLRSISPYSYPRGIALDTEQNLYITMMLTSVVKLSPSGSLLAIFDSVDPPLKRAEGVAVNSRGEIFVSSQQTQHTSHSLTHPLTHSFTQHSALGIDNKLIVSQLIVYFSAFLPCTSRLRL